MANSIDKITSLMVHKLGANGGEQKSFDQLMKALSPGNTVVVTKLD